MQEGIRKRIEASIKKILDYLAANHDKLTDDEVNEALDKVNELKNLLEGFD